MQKFQEKQLSSSKAIFADNNLQDLAAKNQPKCLYSHKIYTYINMVYKNKSKKATHSPTLNTVFMVEDVLKKAKEAITLAELKRRLPKKVMHQTLIQVLDYLQASGKIIMGTKGILWIFTERKELNSLIKRGTEI